MRQGHCSTKRKKAKHLTYEDRVAMEMYIRKTWPEGRKVAYAELGRYMGRGWRGVKAEYLRGLVVNKTHELAGYRAYSAVAAEQRARHLDANKGAVMKLTNTHTRFIEHQVIVERMSPYVAVERMRASALFEWTPCVKTVYNAIGNGLLEVIRESLPYAKTRRKHKTPGRRMAYRTLRGKSIDERPKEADGRKEYGHWEMDTLVAPAKGRSCACLLVMTERLTRQLLAVKMPDRTQRSIARALNRLERATDIFRRMKSVTSDNGSEFWDSEAIEQSATLPGARRCLHFYAHPFRASERGSNENASRIIRRFIPKGTDIGNYTATQVKEIEHRINTMPREILGGLSANQAKEKISNETAA